MAPRPEVVVAVLVCGHFGCRLYTLSTRGDLHMIGCCNNQSRTSSAQWPAPLARGMRIVSTQGTIEVCESSHYLLREDPRSRPAEARAAHSARRLVRGLLTDARFSSRGCPLGMRAYTRVRVLYMINYRVHVYKITR